MYYGTQPNTTDHATVSKACWQGTHCFKIILNYEVFILYENKVTCYLSLI